MIYLMSKTWEVFAQSSELGARVKNGLIDINVFCVHFEIITRQNIFKRGQISYSCIVLQFSE